MAVHAMNILRAAGHASEDVPRAMRESGEEATGILPEPRKLYGIGCDESKRGAGFRQGFVETAKRPPGAAAFL